jgi:hypothetical protein
MVELSDGAIKGAFGQINRNLFLIHDLKVKDGEIEEETKADWVGCGELIFGDCLSVCVRCQRIIRTLRSQITLSKLGEISTMKWRENSTMSETGREIKLDRARDRIRVGEIGAPVVISKHFVEKRFVLSICHVRKGTLDDFDDLVANSVYLHHKLHRSVELVKKCFKMMHVCLSPQQMHQGSEIVSNLGAEIEADSDLICIFLALCFLQFGINNSQSSSARSNEILERNGEIISSLDGHVFTHFHRMDHVLNHIIPSNRKRRKRVRILIVLKLVDHF